MADHLSALTLDTLAAGLPVDATHSAHLASCPACQARLDAVKAERAQVMKLPAFEAVRGQLAPAPRELPRWLVPVIAFAAVVLAIVGSQFLEGDKTILKGGASVELLRDARTPVTEARVGDRLTLAVGADGKGAVVAYSLTAAGKLELLLPSTEVGTGTRVPVGNAFEVTAGSIAVFACFGQHPMDNSAVFDSIFQSMLRSSKAPLETAAPADCAKTKLEVLP